jgi:hypothetical protein
MVINLELRQYGTLQQYAAVEGNQLDLKDKDEKLNDDATRVFQAVTVTNDILISQRTMPGGGPAVVLQAWWWALVERGRSEMTMDEERAREVWFVRSCPGPGRRTKGRLCAATRTEAAGHVVAPCVGCSGVVAWGLV